MSEVFKTEIHQYDNLAEAFKIAIQHHRYQDAKELKKAMLNLDANLHQIGEQ